jgi:hypothetical protein
MENNPMLRERLLAISAAENNDPQANLAVIESAMNRASARGTSLEAQLRFAGQGGYYPTANYKALQTKKRAMYEANLSRALAGSNVSNYATDNSSNQPGNALAARDVSSGRFEETVPNMNGEHFFIPKGQGGGSMRRKYDAWRSGIDSAASSGSTWGNNARAVPWLSNPAAFALLPGGRQTSNTTNNSSTAETHVGSVTVNTQATDAYGIAKDMKGALERFGGFQVMISLQEREYVAARLRSRALETMIGTLRFAD